MDLIAKFLFLSGKFITYATGRTILAIINQSVKIHRHLACKYEELTQVVKPYDNMVELLNARTEDNSIENLNLPSTNVCSETSCQTQAPDDAATRTLHLDAYMPEDLKDKEERCDVCKDLNGKPIDLRSVMEDVETQLHPDVRAVDSADTIADVLSLPMEEKMVPIGPQASAKRDHINTVASLRKQEYTRQCFYGNFLKDCGEGVMTNTGMMSSCSKYANINDLLRNAPTYNSFFKQYSMDESNQNSKDETAEFVGPPETNDAQIGKTSWHTFTENISSQCGPTEILRNPTEDLGEHPTSRPSNIDPSWETFTSNLQDRRFTTTTAEPEVNTEYPQLIRDTTWQNFNKTMEIACTTERAAPIPEESCSDISWEAFNTRIYPQFTSTDVVEVYKELLRQEEQEASTIAAKTEAPMLETKAPWQTCDIHLRGKTVNSTTFRKLSSSSKGDDVFKYIDMLMQQVKTDSNLININQQAFNKLEKRVTQILIQQSLGDRDQVTSKGNFFEVHRNASQKIRKALLHRSRERLARALSNIEKDRYTNEQRLSQQTDDMLIPPKQREALIAKLKHLQVLTKEINKICEMDGMEKFPVKQEHRPRKVFVMKPEQMNIQKFNVPKKWQAPPVEAKAEEPASSKPIDYEDSDAARERLKLMEANLKAFKIFQEYIQNLAITNKSNVVAQKELLKEKIRKAVEKNKMEIAARNDKKRKIDKETATKEEPEVKLEAGKRRREPKEPKPIKEYSYVFPSVHKEPTDPKKKEKQSPVVVKLEKKRDKGDDAKDISDKDKRKEKPDAEDKPRKPTRIRDHGGSAPRLYVRRKGGENQGSGKGGNQGRDDDDPPDDKRYKYPDVHGQKDEKKAGDKLKAKEDDELQKLQEKYRHHYVRKGEDPDSLRKGKKKNDDEIKGDVKKPSDIILNYTIPYNIPYKHKYEKVADQMRSPGPANERKRPWIPGKRKDKVVAAAKQGDDSESPPGAKKGQDEEKPSDVIQKYNSESHVRDGEEKKQRIPDRRLKEEQLKAIKANLTKVDAEERAKLAQDRISGLAVDHRIEPKPHEKKRDDVQAVDKDRPPADAAEQEYRSTRYPEEHKAPEDNYGRREKASMQDERRPESPPVSQKDQKYGTNQYQEEKPERKSLADAQEDQRLGRDRYDGPEHRRPEQKLENVRDKDLARKAQEESKVQEDLRHTRYQSGRRPEQKHEDLRDKDPAQAQKAAATEAHEDQRYKSTRYQEQEQRRFEQERKDLRDKDLRDKDLRDKDLRDRDLRDKDLRDKDLRDRDFEQAIKKAYEADAQERQRYRSTRYQEQEQKRLEQERKDLRDKDLRDKDLGQTKKTSEAQEGQRYGSPRYQEQEGRRPEQKYEAVRDQDLPQNQKAAVANTQEDQKYRSTRYQEQEQRRPELKPEDVRDKDLAQTQKAAVADTQEDQKYRSSQYQQQEQRRPELKPEDVRDKDLAQTQKAAVADTQEDQKYRSSQYQQQEQRRPELKPEDVRDKDLAQTQKAAVADTQEDQKYRSSQYQQQEQRRPELKPENVRDIDVAKSQKKSAADTHEEQSYRSTRYGEQEQRRPELKHEDVRDKDIAPYQQTSTVKEEQRYGSRGAEERTGYQKPSATEIQDDHKGAQHEHKGAQPQEQEFRRRKFEDLRDTDMPKSQYQDPQQRKLEQKQDVKAKDLGASRTESQDGEKYRDRLYQAQESRTPEMKGEDVKPKDMVRSQPSQPVSPSEIQDKQKLRGIRYTDDNIPASDKEDTRINQQENMKKVSAMERNTSAVEEGVDEQGNLRDRRQMLGLKDASHQGQSDIPQENRHYEFMDSGGPKEKFESDESRSVLQKTRPEEVQPEQKDPDYKIKAEKAVQLMEAMQKEKAESAAKVDQMKPDVDQIKPITDSHVEHIKLKVGTQSVEVDRPQEPSSEGAKNLPSTDEPDYKLKEEKAVEMMKIREIEAKKRLVRIDIEFEEPHHGQTDVGMKPERRSDEVARKTAKIERDDEHILKPGGVLPRKMGTAVEEPVQEKIPVQENKPVLKTPDQIRQEIAAREREQQLLRRSEETAKSNARKQKIAVSEETYAELKRRGDSPEEVRKRVLEIARSEYSRGQHPAKIEDEHVAKASPTKKDGRSIPRKQNMKVEGMPNKQREKSRSEGEVRQKASTRKDERTSENIPEREHQSRIPVHEKQRADKVRKEVQPIEVYDVRHVKKVKREAKAAADKDAYRKLKAAESEALSAKKIPSKASHSEEIKGGEQHPEYASKKHLAERGKGAYKSRSPRPETPQKVAQQVSTQQVPTKQGPTKQGPTQQVPTKQVPTQQVSTQQEKPQQPIRRQKASRESSVDREPTKQAKPQAKTIHPVVKHVVGKRPDSIIPKTIRPEDKIKPEEKIKLEQTTKPEEKVKLEENTKPEEKTVTQAVKAPPATSTTKITVTPDALPDETLQSKFATRKKREKQRTIVDKDTGMVTKEQQVEITEMYVEKHDGVDQDVIVKGQSPKPKESKPEEAKPKMTFAERRKAYLAKLRKQHQEAKQTQLEGPTKASKATSTPKKSETDKMTIHDDVVEAIQEENSMAMKEVTTIYQPAAYTKINMDGGDAKPTGQKAEDNKLIGIADDSVEDNKEQQMAAAIEERIMSSSQEQVDERITEYVKSDQMKAEDVEKMNLMIEMSGVTPSGDKAVALDDDSVEENKEYGRTKWLLREPESPKLEDKAELENKAKLEDKPKQKEVKLPPDAIYMASLEEIKKAEEDSAKADKERPSKRYIVTDTLSKSNLLKDQKADEAKALEVDEDSIEANKADQQSIYETVYEHTVAAAKKIEDTQLLSAQEIVDRRRKEEELRNKYNIGVKPDEKGKSTFTYKDIYDSHIKRAEQTHKTAQAEQTSTIEQVAKQQPVAKDEEQVGTIEQVAKQIPQLAQEDLKTEVQQNFVEENALKPQEAEKEFLMKDKKPIDAESARMAKLIDEQRLKADQKPADDQPAEMQATHDAQKDELITKRAPEDSSSAKVSKLMDEKAATPVTPDQTPEDPSQIRINQNRVNWDSAVADALRKARQANASEPKSELVADPKRIEGEQVKVGGVSEPKVAEPDQKAADEVIAKYGVEKKVESKETDQKVVADSKVTDPKMINLSQIPVQGGAKVMPKLKQRVKKGKPKVNVEVKVTYTKKVERKVREAIAKDVPRIKVDEQKQPKAPKQEVGAEIRLHPPQEKTKLKKRRPTKLYKPFIPGVSEESTKKIGDQDVKKANDGVETQDGGDENKGGNKK